VRLLWSPLADAQVDDTVAYIAADDPAAALAWLELMLELVRSLADYPDSGRVVPELQREDVRELIVAPYRVMYRRTADAVEIAAIRHGARDFEADELARQVGRTSASERKKGCRKAAGRPRLLMRGTLR